MEFINEMLSDKQILNQYTKIDEINPYPSNHGMKHIHGVLSLVDKIAPLFKLSDREILILKTSVIFHDIGQIQGRKDHGLRSAEFAKTYLQSKNIFSPDEIEMIYSAVETHDEFQDYCKLKNKFSWFVNLIDKFDFSRTRLEDNYRQKFEYSVYEDIYRLEFSIDDYFFRVYIKVIDKPQIISEDVLFSRNLFSKSMHTLIKFCEHFKLLPEVYLGNKKLDLNKINRDVICDK